MSQLKGYTVVDGKVVPRRKRKSVSQRIREKKSKRQKVVSKAHASLHSKIGNGNGTKSSERA